MVTPYTMLMVAHHLTFYLVLFEVCANSPPFIISQRLFVLLEKSVDAGNSSVPAVFQVLQCEPAVLGIGLMTLQSILSPHSLGVNELTFPRHDVSTKFKSTGM